MAAAEEAALEADLEEAERVAEAVLEVLDRAELAADEAEEREDDALEDLAMVGMLRVACELEILGGSVERKEEVQDGNVANKQARDTATCLKSKT